MEAEGCAHEPIITRDATPDAEAADDVGLAEILQKSLTSPQKRPSNTHLVQKKPTISGWRRFSK